MRDGTPSEQKRHEQAEARQQPAPIQRRSDDLLAPIRIDNHDGPPLGSIRTNELLPVGVV